jgi:hypothetical protein
MFQYRWQVAGGKSEDFPFEENDMESFNIISAIPKACRETQLRSEMSF